VQPGPGPGEGLAERVAGHVQDRRAHGVGDVEADGEEEDQPLGALQAKERTHDAADREVGDDQLGLW